MISTSNSVILADAVRPLVLCTSTSILCSSSEKSMPCLTGSSENKYICLRPNGIKLQTTRIMNDMYEYQAYHREKRGGGRSQRPWMYHEDQTT